MGFTYADSAAYDLADAVLRKFGADGIQSTDALYMMLGTGSYSITALDILNAYKLIDSKFTAPRVYSTFYFITENGKKALESGGVRQYILDYDLSFSIVDDFPKLIRVEKKNIRLQLGTYIVRCESEMEDFRDSFNPAEHLYFPRYSIRPSKYTTSNTPQMNNSNNTYNIGTIIKDSQNGNTNSHISATPPPQNGEKPAKEGPWTKVNTITAIIVGFVVIVGTVIAWLAYYHPLK